ncbi:hypothetical protein HELRODRAFT_83199, partial [Helobdella robusta]|uniref:Ras-related protein Rab n=1 Tax=Helobdella robusta TaxID=6412 RepID=T1G519_HELRO
EYLFKVLVIGDLGTGKTSFIKRYVHHSFSDHYRATIGVDFALKVIEWDDERVVRLQLWDVAGQERFGNMTRVYYKEAVGCILVYDVNKMSSFEGCNRWKEDLDEKVSLPNGDRIPCVLVGNKKDKDSESEPFVTGNLEEFCKSKGYAGWFETSAKDNINVDETIKFLISCVSDVKI